jgi:hypothetical protein
VQVLSLARDAQLGGVPWHVAPFVLPLLAPASRDALSDAAASEPPPPLLLPYPACPSSPASSDAGSVKPDPGLLDAQPAASAIAPSTDATP